MKCPECSGHGKVEYADPEVGPCADDIVECHVCKGTGKVHEKNINAVGSWEEEIQDCLECKKGGDDK